MRRMWMGSMVQALAVALMAWLGMTALGAAQQDDQPQAQDATEDQREGEDQQEDEAQRQDQPGNEDQPADEDQQPADAQRPRPEEREGFRAPQSADDDRPSAGEPRSRADRQRRQADQEDQGQDRPQRRRAEFRSADEDDREIRRDRRREERDDRRRDDERDDDERDDEGRDDEDRRADRDDSARWETGISFETDPNERLIVSELEEDAVLARAGLRRGDVILSINGRVIASREDFLRWIHVSRPDRPIAMVVWRDGAEQELFLDVYRFDGREEDRFDDDYADGRRASLGVTLDMRWDNAAVVESVFHDSPADEAGLKPGDQIVRVNGRRIVSPLQLIEIVAGMQPGDGVEIEIARRVTRSMDVVLDARESFGDESVRYAEQRRALRRQLDDDELQFEEEMELDDDLELELDD